MPRVSRRDIIVPGGTYHVIARGNDKAEIFHDEGDYRRYLSVLRVSKAPQGVSVYHYALMPNHVHLLVRVADKGLSAFMQTVQTAYAKHYCLRYGRVGHVWQGRFKSILIESDAHLFACGNYIEMNPVRAGFAPAPEAWPYSSYRVYAFGHADPLVDIDPFFSGLHEDEERRRVLYRDMLSKTRA